MAVPKKPVAVVTMSYNEGPLLGLWLKHYGRQVGARSCYVLDHGSTDGSTEGLEAHVMRLPRSRLDEVARSVLVSDVCADLLRTHEAVLFTDVDEIVVADPLVAETLTDYANGSRRAGPVTLFGMDLLSLDHEDEHLDLSTGILLQRDWLWPADALCKPTFIREPYRWSPGFHLHGDRAAFDALYMFHMAYADQATIAWRQRKRNTTQPIGGSEHHLVSPEEMLRFWRVAAANMPRIAVELDGCPAMQDFVREMTPTCERRSPSLWRVPERFRTTF